MAPIELHIWSRAFGLPSIDPECLAAIAFLSAAIPRSWWVLVESNNTGLAPNQTLPALKDNGKWIGGFDDIVKYVNEKSSGQSDIDSQLSGLQRARSIAYRSFIRETVAPIVYLSLYITPKNYQDVTRPAFTSFLPFPTQYQIPNNHHARAVALTSHLKSLIQELRAENSKLPLVSTAFAGLTTPSTSSSSSNKDKDGKEKITTRIKLRNLVADPLDVLLEKIKSSGGRYIHGGNKGPSSIDCLLVGYLSLLAYPHLPSPWAKEIIETEFKDVVGYLDRLRPVFFPDDILTQKPDEADRLTVSSWAKQSVESWARNKWDNRIPKNDDDAAKIGLPLWGILQGVAGIAAVVGGVFAYRGFADKGVEVEVSDEIGTPVYTSATAQVGDVQATGVETVEREPLPIFKAEDMLGL